MLRFLAMGVFLLSAAILAACGLGRQRASDAANGFERCALPCFAGIIPGVTDVQEARFMLEGLTGSRSSEQTAASGKWVYSTLAVQILLSSNFDRAVRLDIDSIQQPALITLGDTILTLGRPSMIYALPLNSLDEYEVFLNYSTGSYGVYFLFRTNDRLDPQIHADAVKIYALTPDALSIPLFPTERGQQWRGFSVLRLNGSP